MTKVEIQALIVLLNRAPMTVPEQLWLQELLSREDKNAAKVPTLASSVQSETTPVVEVE